MNDRTHFDPNEPLPTEILNAIINHPTLSTVEVNALIQDAHRDGWARY